MKDRVRKPLYKCEKSIDTAYPESEAIIYDQKRFFDPKGNL